MDLPIHTGGKRIISSGNLISIGDSVEIVMSMFKVSPNPKLRFSFSSSSEFTESKMELSINQEKQIVELKLFNFDNSLDAGNSELIKIGLIDNKDVFLNFRTRKVGSSRTIDYTFYQNE